MNQSESISKLAAALVAAHAEVENATKDSQNPFFKSNYASLNSVLGTIKPVFERHGLAVVQLPSEAADGFTGLESIILHESGEWISQVAAAPIPIKYTSDSEPRPPDAQSVGSAITYLRRYSLAALAGITQEDDDGNAASNYAPDKTSRGGLDRRMQCPQTDCGSNLWNNIEDKKTKPGSKSPDLKCSNKECGWAVWLDSWSDVLIGEAEAACKAEYIDEKRRDKIIMRVQDLDVEAMVLAQKFLNELTG
jgi:hypothetical protein